MSKKPLNRKQKRALERKRKKLMRKQRIMARRGIREKVVVTGGKAKVVREISKVKQPEPTISEAEMAKRKAEEAIEIMRAQIVELQIKEHNLSGYRRNQAIDTIDRMQKKIKQIEDLIEVYDEWIKRETQMLKLAMETAKGLKKGEKHAK